MSKSVNDYGESIPSKLRGSVVVNVTLKNIMLYIIVVFYRTLVRDVFPPFKMSLLCLVIEVKSPL